MSITIRYYGSKDYERVNELRRYVNELHVMGRPDIFRPGFCEALEKYLTQVAEADDSDVAVALLDGNICGYAILRYKTVNESAYGNARRFCDIEEIAVDPEYTRLGVGRSIIDFCRDAALKKGIKKIELSMYEFNASALKFYETLGFKTVRRYMELELSGEDYK